VGTFAQTFNATSWTARSVTTGDLYAVACVDNMHGWTAGAGGAVAHTSDGGQSWTWQDAHTWVSLRAIRFGTTTLGVLAGDGGVLEVTRDGGTTWNVIPALTSASLRGAAIALDAGVMIVVGDGGVVLRSRDGGSTWVSTILAGAADFHGVATDPEGHLTLAVDSAGTVWSSVDAGATFVREASTVVALDAVSVSDDATQAIAAGAQGAVIQRSPDATWHAISSGTQASLHAARIAGNDDSEFYVAGDSGTLLVSTDRGSTWTPVRLATGATTLYGLDDF